MENEIRVDLELDLKGLLCPMPMVKVSQNINNVPVGTPNRERSFCCGGGSGMVAVPEWKESRMKAGKPKAEQIKTSKAKGVVASCDNRRLQIEDLNEKYKLGVRVASVMDLLSEAIITAPNEAPV